MTTLSIITNEYPPLALAGAGNTARLLVQNLIENGFSVRVITSKYDPYSSLPVIEKTKNLVTYRFQVPRLGYLYKPSLFFTYQMMSVSPKIFNGSSLIHAMNYRDIAFLQKPRLPLLSNIIDYYPEFVPFNPFHYPYPEKGKLLKYLHFQWFKCLDHLALKNSDSLIFNSHFTQRAVCGYHGVSKASEVIYKGINPHDFKHDAPKEIDVLFIGSRFEVKGAKELIKAVYSLKPLFPHIRCVMVGRPAKIDFNYEGWIQKLGLEKNIRILPQQSQEQLSNLYAQSRIYYLGSYMEALGQTLMEAMASQLPVITTPVGGIPELVDTSHGVFVQPGDSRGLSLAIQDLLGNERKRALFGKRGRRKILSVFNVKRMVSDYLCSYEKYL